MTKLFKNGIDVKWILLLVGIVAISGIAIATTNPYITNNGLSIFDGLQVINNALFNSTIVVNNTSGGLKGITIIGGGSNTQPTLELIDYNSTPNDWMILLGVNSINDGYFTIRDNRQNAPRFTIDPNGNAAIGATTSSYKLSVAGTMAVTGISSTSGTAYIGCVNSTTKEITVNSGSVNTCTVSAEKYKDIKGNFNDSTVFNKFSQLEPIVFTYKDDKNHLEKFGFSANKVAVLYPQTVYTHYNGNGTYVRLILNQSDPTKADSIQYSDGVISSIEGINFEMFSAILVNQVQDQQFQIDTQAAQLRNICRNNPQLCS